MKITTEQLTAWRLEDGRATIAVVLDEDGNYYDRCWNWESGQSYAHSEGMRVIAVNNDGSMTKDKAQRMYDYERECFRDCFGLETA